MRTVVFHAVVKGALERILLVMATVKVWMLTLVM